MSEQATLVSVSGGKDSTATLILALERLPKEHIFPAFADTGHEHEQTLAYLDYLERRLGVRIARLRADLTADWWRRRDYVRDEWPASLRRGTPGRWAHAKEDHRRPVDCPTRGCEWTPPGPPLSGGEADAIVARAIAVLERGPFGIPFLDLAVIKGRFPSRRAQFCTEELKRYPLDAYAMSLLSEHRSLENWQGVRADESANRKDLAEVEETPEGWTIHRPILRWTAVQVFAKLREAGVEPNPLYKQGMNRVGCFPCINVSKDELWNIAERYPEHIARVAEWEKLAAAARRCGQATFFHAPDPKATPTIYSFVEWSRTAHGGQQFDLLKAMGPPPGCSSSYGLCETDGAGEPQS